MMQAFSMLPVANMADRTTRADAAFHELSGYWDRIRILEKALEIKLRPDGGLRDELTLLKGKSDALTPTGPRLPDPRSDTDRFLAVVRTELVLARDRMRTLEKQISHWSNESLRDPLTGLFNRRAFDDRMEELVRRNKSQAVPFCMAIFDLDHFKKVNDTLGHQAGDLALRKVAEKAMRNYRQNDFVARYGGEEFVVLMEGVDLIPAVAAAERLRKTVAAKKYSFGDKAFGITISIGIAPWLGADDAAEDIIKRADECLYAAKEAGRNYIVVQNARLGAAMPEELGERVRFKAFPRKRDAVPEPADNQPQSGASK